jgi:hypothetical protein
MQDQQEQTTRKSKNVIIAQEMMKNDELPELTQTNLNEA